MCLFLLACTSFSATNCILYVPCVSSSLLALLSVPLTVNNICHVSLPPRLHFFQCHTTCVLYLHIYIYISLSIYLFICVCVYIYIYIFKYIFIHISLPISCVMSKQLLRVRTIKETKSNHPQKKRSLCCILSRIRHASENNRGVFTKTGSNVQGHEFTQSTLPKQASKQMHCATVQQGGQGGGQPRVQKAPPCLKNLSQS